MPRKRGSNTYKGYESPPTTGYPPAVREFMRTCYGSCRENNPGEIPARKSRCTRVCWTGARKKFPFAFE